MAMTILNYARFLKKAMMRHIVYGAFEVLGSAPIVKNLDVSERIAPIVDLTPMVTLMDWTNGIDHFLRSGDASIIQRLTDGQVREMYIRTPSSRSSDRNGMMKSVREAASRHRALANQLDAFTKSLQTCRGPLLSQAVTELKERLCQAKGIDLLSFRPLAQLLDEVERRIENFSGDPVMVGYEAAEWCLAHGLIQQGFTFLREGMFTAICHVQRMDVMNPEERELVSKALGIINRRTPEKKWRVAESRQSQLKQLVTFLESYRDQLTWYGALVDYRNSINHAGYNQPIPPERFAPQLKKILQASHPFFF